MYILLNYRRITLLPSLNPLNLFKKKDDGHLEYQRALVCSDAANTHSPPEQEYAAMVGKMGYLVMDERLIEFLFSNPCLQPLIAVLSPVNSTTKLDKHEAELKRIRIENIFTMLKLTMDPKIYEANGMEMLDGLRMYAHDRVNDAADGWKGHIVTEQTRRYTFRENEKK